MLKQIFSPAELAKIIRKENVWKFNLWNSGNTQDAYLKKCSAIINDENFELSPLVANMQKGKMTYTFARSEDWVAVKKVDFFLRRIYKVKPSDRNIIIKQVKILLKDSGELCLIRMDIKSFYESVSFVRIIDKLKKDMIVSYKGIKILESLLRRTQENHEYKEKGIPRGIGISATLSEIALKGVDREMKDIEGVFYYMRFVDDIIIVADNKYQINVYDEATRIIKNYDFFINDYKTALYVFKDNIPTVFSYLGYKFSVVKKPQKERKENDIEVEISEDKIKKIKTRIYKSFLQFIKDNNSYLLLNRLKYLSNSILLDKDGNGFLYGGISYNYKEITDGSCLSTLDSFIFAITSGYGRIGQDVTKLLSQADIKRIRKVSFKTAFERKLKSRFTRKKVIKLRDIFKYE